MKENLYISSTIGCDVLIIGGGGAGLRAAAEIKQRRPGAKVVIVSKVAHVQKSHTVAAQGGVAAVDPRDPADRNIFHMFDTWKGSDCTADQDVIKLVIENAWDQILWLENHGMHFSRNEDGRMARRTFGGHTLNFGQSMAFRVKFEADRTGKGIIDAGWWESLKAEVTYINQAAVTELIIEDGICKGAVVFRHKDGEFITVAAKATVVSTGGCGQVFNVTSNCRQNTGDGVALALEAGLPVMDMEAIQFHPTGIVGPGILASEALRGEGGILRNSEGEPFMERYAPTIKDLAPRDIVARSIVTEIREGRGILNEDHNIQHVWIDIRHLPDYVHDVKLPEISGFFKKFVNVDPKTELAPVCPTAHYQMGGIPTDINGQVMSQPGAGVPGLYAIGESANASLHGFNRLGTNSLLELITMGQAVGDHIADWLDESQNSGTAAPAATAGQKTFAKLGGYLAAEGADHLVNIRETMREMMMDKVGVYRTEEGLNEAIESLMELKERAEHCALTSKTLTLNQELNERLELDNLLSVALVMTKGALARQESRGGHFREDYPVRSDEFNYHTLAWLPTWGEVNLGRREINMSIFEAQDEHYEKFTFIERKY